MTATTPCARCGSTGGLAWRGQRAGVDPRRGDGARFGVPGLLCLDCINWAERQWKARRVDRLRAAKNRAAVATAKRRSLTAAQRWAETMATATADNGRLALRIIPRVAVVRRAKQIKEAAGLCPLLTDDELDLILPPVDCQRTQIRLARGGLIFRTGGPS